MNKGELRGILRPMKLIDLGGNQALAERIASTLDKPSLETTVQHFSDRETQVNITGSIRGCDVHVVQSIQDPVNENFTELMIVLDALHRTPAHFIDVVISYMAYSRQDTKNRSYEPTTAKLLANLLQLTDINDLIAVDLHALQIQGFYDVPVDYLHAVPILAQYFLDNGIAGKNDDDIVAVSPDHSGARLARIFGSYFDAPIAIVNQRGARYGAEAHDMIGDVKDETIIVVDDLIDTGSRIASSTKSVLVAGARRVYVAATHALLSQNTIGILNRLSAEQIVIIDTIKHKKYPGKVVRLFVARLLAKDTDYTYSSKSIHQIFDKQNRIQGWFTLSFNIL